MVKIGHVASYGKSDREANMKPNAGYRYADNNAMEGVLPQFQQ